jgi:hypothetical protein
MTKSSQREQYKSSHSDNLELDFIESYDSGSESDNGSDDELDNALKSNVSNFYQSYEYNIVNSAVLAYFSHLAVSYEKRIKEIEQAYNLDEILGDINIGGEPIPDPLIAKVKLYVFEEDFKLCIKFAEYLHRIGSGTAITNLYSYVEGKGYIGEVGRSIAFPPMNNAEDLHFDSSTSLTTEGPTYSVTPTVSISQSTAKNYIEGSTLNKEYDIELL